MKRVAKKTFDALSNLELRVILANTVRLDPTEVMLLNTPEHLVGALLEHQDKLMETIQSEGFTAGYWERLPDDIADYLTLCLRFSLGEIRKVPDRAEISTAEVVLTKKGEQAQEEAPGADAAEEPAEAAVEEPVAEEPVDPPKRKLRTKKLGAAKAEETPALAVVPEPEVEVVVEPEEELAPIPEEMQPVEVAPQAPAPDYNALFKGLTKEVIGLGEDINDLAGTANDTNGTVDEP